MKSIVPPYVRINRVIRDIPSWQIEGGSKISNLRQYLATEMRKQNISCQCIRCREIKSSQVKIQELKLKKYHYPASGGEEIFFSFETKKDKKLVAFLRLRWPAKLGSSEQLPVLRNKALIRELHTYGQLVSLEKRNQKAAQHFGLGKKLIKLAEQMSKEKGYQKIAIIAGVGVREYYRHLGYRLQETYMVKTLAPRRSLGSHGVGIRKSKKRRNKK
jgi:elongator complex protein 3